MTMRPVRIFTFPDRAEALLLYIPEGLEVSLPPLKPPFVRFAVAQILSNAGISAFVKDSGLGRFRDPVSRAVTADARRIETERQRHARLANIDNIKRATSEQVSDLQRRRSELVVAKLKLDEESAALEVSIREARALARSPDVLDHKEMLRRSQILQDLVSRHLEVKKEMTALATQLGELRQQLRDEHDRKEPARLDRFLSLVRDHLGADRYRELWDEADRGSNGAAVQGRSPDGDARLDPDSKSEGAPDSHGAP